MAEADITSQQVAELEKLQNISIDDRVRGTELPDIEQRCFDHCRLYLGGSWAKATSPVDITVKRVGGGLSNQLYRVTLNETVARVVNEAYPDEPNEVAVKYFQNSPFAEATDRDKASGRLNEVLVLVLLGQAEIGPKIYGVFEDGYIQGFYQHQQFRLKQQQDPALLGRLAAQLARLHHSSLPIAKKSYPFYDTIDRFLTAAYQNCPEMELIEKLNLPTLKEHDLRTETQFVISQAEALNSPTVCSHNDFRGSNILATEPDGRVLLCDFEGVAYGPRCFDLATFLTEWGNADLFQLNEHIPSDEQLAIFIRLYIAECDKLVPGYSSKPTNSLEQHLKETKVFILVNLMFFIAFMIQQTESFMSAMTFDATKKMYSCEHMYKVYMNYRAALVEDGTIRADAIAGSPMK